MKMKNKVLSMLLSIVMLVSVVSVLSVSVSAASNDVTGINSGTTYYIKNLLNGKYLDVYNGNDSNFNDVWTYTFNASEAQKWRVVRNSDGTYTFFAVVSTHNRVLDVTGSNVDIYSYYNTWDCEKFTLVRNTTLAYGGTYQIKYGNQYVVFDIAKNTVKVNSYGDYLNALWSFEPVNKNDADVYTFKYKDGSFLFIPTYFDTTPVASTFTSKCQNMGYNPYHFSNKDAASAYTFLKYDSIWTFWGHGVYDSNNDPAATIAFMTSNGGNNGYLTASSNINNGTQDRAIDDLALNALAKEQCVLYMGCGTGVSYYGYNLVSSTFNKGAHFVLGTTKKITVGAGTKWIKKFYEKADTGATIRECLDNANYYQNLGSLYYEGDVYVKLK